MMKANDESYPINYHQTGSIRLGQNSDRMEEFHHVAAMASAMGIEYEMLDTDEMKKRHPFLATIYWAHFGIPTMATSTQVS